MISPEEIKIFAEKQFQKYLQGILSGEYFIPIKVPVGVQKTTRPFQEISRDITNLQQNAKPITGFGYELVTSKRNYNKHGLNTYIDNILFNHEIDFLKFIGKEKEVNIFKQTYPKLLSRFSELQEWIHRKPERVVINANKWDDLLKVCSYFSNNPKPNLYIRQLPIENLSTKFIQENREIIISLLNHLLPAYAKNEETNDFEKRFGLKEPESLIRFRILDKAIFINGISDISMPISQFESLFFKDSIDNIFIVENQMCVLTFPPIPNSIVVFGSGKAVSNLSKITWVKYRKIFYWGDLDVEGLEMLSMVREFNDSVTPLMMDLKTFETFEIYHSEGKNSVKNIPSNLSEDEIELFNFLKLLPIKLCRLEQEYIPQLFVEESVTALI
jgi:hypothetical protein